MSPSDRLSRRGFLAASGRGAAAVGLGAVVAGCGGDSRFSRAGRRMTGRSRRRHPYTLGLDTYTLHRCLSTENPELRKDLYWLIDELEDHDLKGLQIDPSHFPGDDDATLARLEEAVRPHDYYLEFGMGGWDVQRMARRIELTGRFGGKALRTFCGGELTPQEDIENYIRWAPPALREAAEYAEKHDVYIAMENHGDFTSEQLEELIRRADHPRVGACLDTGNSLFRREDPVECARRLAPYTLSMHLKDWVMTFDENDHPHWEERVLGEGEARVAEQLEIVLAVKPDLYIALETPVQPSDDERETIAREYRHFVACTKAAHRILSRVRA